MTKSLYETLYVSPRNHGNALVDLCIQEWFEWLLCLQRGPESSMDLRPLSAIEELLTALIGLVRQFLVRFGRFLISFRGL